MGLTSAMYTGLSGINVNQVRIDAIGHNLANVNTTAFKGSRTLFQTQFSETLSHGNGPSDISGGVNPTQLGRGAVVGTIQRTFAPGSVEMTGINSDLAVEGAGFFVIRRPSGQQIGALIVAAFGQHQSHMGDGKRDQHERRMQHLEEEGLAPTVVEDPDHDADGHLNINGHHCNLKQARLEFNAGPVPIDAKDRGGE